MLNCKYLYSLYGDFDAMRDVVSFGTELRGYPSQPAHDVRTTLYGRWNDVKTWKRRLNNVVLTSYEYYSSLFGVQHIDHFERLSKWSMFIKNYLVDTSHWYDV